METRPSSAALMTCRYCLLREMGHCRKVSPLKKSEPRYLRMGNGKLLRLEFDCQHCQMLIWEADVVPGCK